MSTLRALFVHVAQYRTALLFAGALLFGAAAAVGMRNYIGEQLAMERDRLLPRQQMVELIVAKRDLARGDTVDPDTMAIREIPQEFAPGGAIPPDRFDALIGARLAVPMRSGEPLLAGVLAGAEAAGFSSRLRPGIRAMTVAVDEVNSLSGMLQPGDRIDLLLSIRPQPTGGGLQPEITRTLMQGVLVLATGRQVRAAADTPAGRSFTAITVEVDPEQAQKLVVAQRNGRLTAMLRNPDDRQPHPDRKLDVNALLGLPDPAPPASMPAPKPAPEVIVGGRGVLPTTPASDHPMPYGAHPMTAATFGAAEQSASDAPLSRQAPTDAAAARRPRPGPAAEEPAADAVVLPDRPADTAVGADAVPVVRPALIR